MLTLRRRLRDELWGLCSHPLPLGSFAMGCRLLVGCSTLGEALRMGLRYYRLLIRDFVPHLHVQDGIAGLSVISRTPAVQTEASQAYAERCFCFLGYGLVSWLVGQRISLVGVDYPYTALGRSLDAGALFRAPLYYGQPRTGWRFEAHWLELPVVQNEHSLRQFLQQAPTSLLVKYRDHTSMAERIRRILRRHLTDGLPSPSLDDISRQLALTPQTLRRRLRQEGQGFRSLKDDLRRDAAIEYLARADLTLPEIAVQLGFSEASTFHRAFKHWTGVAPGEYRQTRLCESTSNPAGRE
jgi:AraC-like DNA-binding protein